MILTVSDFADHTAMIQAAIDENKGRTVVVPSGRYIHAGVLLDGATYNNTHIVCIGELVLKPRPSTSDSNFHGTWTGLIIKDCSFVTINYRGDGQRTLQTDQEGIHLVGIAGANNISFPTFYGKEVRGDGIYISQSSWTTDSTVPYNITFGTFEVVNSANDGRNAMSIISGAQIAVGSFRSIRVGGVLYGGTVTMPGGFDIEPNYDYQTVRDVHVGNAYIETAGNFGLQILGKSVASLGGNVRGVVIDDYHVVSTCQVGCVPVSFRHCNGVTASGRARYLGPVGVGNAGLIVDNCNDMDIQHASEGGFQFGGRVGYEYRVVNSNISVRARNYTVAGLQTVYATRCNFKVYAYGGAEGSSGLYTRKVSRTVAQDNNVYELYCPKAATSGAYGAYNNPNDAMTFANCRFLGGDVTGYATFAAALNGFGDGINRIDVRGEIGRAHV